MSDDLEYRIIKLLGHSFPEAYTNLGLEIGLRESQRAVNRAIEPLVKQGFVHHYNMLYLYGLTYKGWARFTRDRNSAKLELLTAFS